MSGDVPDPASWVAGATKSELEKLLVFLGDATDPESKLWIADYWSESKWHVCSCMGTLRVWTHVVQTWTTVDLLHSAKQCQSIVLTNMTMEEERTWKNQIGNFQPRLPNDDARRAMGSRAREPLCPTQQKLTLTADISMEQRLRKAGRLPWTAQDVIAGTMACPRIIAHRNGMVAAILTSTGPKNHFATERPRPMQFKLDSYRQYRRS